MIVGRALTKAFGSHRVLQDASFHLAPGERVALLGLNGAGKTTLMRCLLGLLPFEGTLEVAGYDVRTNGRAARARLGYVPQRAPHFDGDLREVITFFAKLHGVDATRVHDKLHTLGLSIDDHGDKPVHTLSGGMLQKVLLALALAADVDLLLLDEPTANLDPKARREFLRALEEIDEDTTVLLASHRLADVEALTDRLLVLHDGAIAFDGGIEQLRRRGTATTLWLNVRAEDRTPVRALLENMNHGSTVISNGHAIGVVVDRRTRADVLVAVRAAGFEVEDLWTEDASMSDLLESVVRKSQVATRNSQLA